MASDHDEIEASGQLLATGELERERRIELIRRLLKKRDDPRAVDVLKRSLEKPDEDPEVLKTVILGLGFVRDKSVVALLKPFLEHASMRVIAATIKSLCRLDPNLEIATLHPLLRSRDSKARTAAVLALLSSNRRMGTEVLHELATSPSESLRETAIACLDTLSTADAETIRIEMFLRETKMDLLKELARALKHRGVSEGGIAVLNKFRSELRASASTALEPEPERLRHTKLEVLDRLCRRAYEKLDMSAGTIGSLEGMVEKDADKLSASKEAHDKQTEEKRKTERVRQLTAKTRAATRGPRWGRVVAGFAVVIVLGGGLHAGWQSGKSAPALAVGKPPPVEIASSIGKAGERVSVVGLIVHVSEAGNVVSMSGPGVVISAVFRKLPVEAVSGAKVRLEGTVHSVKGKSSLTVIGESLTPSS